MMNKQVQIIYYPIILSMLYTCIFWLKQIKMLTVLKTISLELLKFWFTKVFCVGVNFCVQEI